MKKFFIISSVVLFVLGVAFIIYTIVLVGESGGVVKIVAEGITWKAVKVIMLLLFAAWFIFSSVGGGALAMLHKSE